MPSTIPKDAIAAIEVAIGAEDSATALINTFASRMQAAVDAALQNGASAAELAPITDELVRLKTSADALAAAVAANPGT
jgi:hypothetical protein